MIDNANLIQGSPEWHEARLGIVTASNFSKVLCKGSGRNTYLMHKVAERQQGLYVEGFHNKAMDNGVENEQCARKYYEDKYEVSVELIGFVKQGDLGCSPDGFVGDDGIIEIKCSEGPSHYRIVIKKKMPTTHIPQVQGNLWLTERKWCDFISYDPWGKYNPFFCVRVMRDDIYINEQLKPACEKFVQELNDLDQIIRS